MLIPHVLSRGTSVAAQRAHIPAVLEAGGDLPSVIYNSPCYGYETKADLFFDLRSKFPSLVDFKELSEALTVLLSAFDEGADLVLYYKHLMVLEGHPEYECAIQKSDALAPSQKAFLEEQWKLFRTWWSSWDGAKG